MKLRYLTLVTGLVVTASSQAGFQTLPKVNTSNQAEQIPGQVVVKLRAENPNATNLSLAQADSGLDNLLKRHKFKQKRVLKPAKNASLAATASQTPSSPLERIYLLDIGSQSVESSLAQLRQDPSVEYAEPNYRLKTQWVPNDPLFASQGSWGQSFDDLWGLKIIEASTAWDLSQGAGIVVAVIDTGVYNHPDLQANLWTNPNEIAGNGIDDDHNGYIDDAKGWNFVNQSPDVSDGNGHGTHVSGTIAAVGNNALGVVGVAPKAKIMPLKGLANDGSGSSFDLYQGMIYAADNGAKVINNSWGGFGYSYLGIDASNYAVNKGVVVVAAAGNYGMDSGQFNPANLPAVITVAASGLNDSPALSHGNPFSNTGSKIDIAAPGQDILSLLSPGCQIEQDAPELVVAGQYLRLNGTSMATPHVAGAAALILSRFPNYSPEQVRWVLRDSADRSSDWNLNYGYGRLNVRRALLTTNPPQLNAQLAPEHNLSLSGKTLSAKGSANGNDFQQYSLAIANFDLVNPPVFTTLATTNVAVNNGLLANLDLSSYSATNKSYILRLRSKAADGRAVDTYSNIAVDASIKTGWPVANGDWEIAGTSHAPAIADLDGDGQKEVISVSDQQLLVTLANGTVKAGFPIPLPGITQGSPVIADIDADGKLDIALLLDVTGNLAPIYVYNQQGSLLTGFPAGKITGLTSNAHSLNHHQALAAADMNGDGLIDLIANYLALEFNSSGGVVSSQQYLQVVNHQGQTLPGWPVMLSNEKLFDSGAFAVADLNHDGSNEIVVNTPIAPEQSVIDVYAANAVRKSRQALSSIAGFGPLYALFNISIADMDADNLSEILLETSEGSGIGLYLLDESLTVLPGWPKKINGSLNTADLIDVNTDGKADALIYEGSSLKAFTKTGLLMSGFPQVISDLEQFGYSGHTRFNVANWGGQPVVFYGTNSYLNAQNLATGLPVTGWPKYLPFAMAMGVAFGDLEGNGKLDVMSQTYRPQLLAWEDSLSQVNLQFSIPNQALTRTNTKTANLAKTYPSMFVRGTFNAWTTTAMTLVADKTWQADVTFTSASTERFKFDVTGNWSLNFGENNNAGRNATGIAEASGGDIYPIEGAGKYRILLNDQTKSFSVRKIGAVPNQAPVARVGADQSLSGAGRVTLNGSTSSDSDGQIVSYLWSQVSGSLSGVSILNANQAQTEVQFPAYSGTTPVVRRFRLTVTDNGGLTSSIETSISQNGSSGFTKVYPQVLVRGTANNWASTSMTLVANNTWETNLSFGSASTERFKFDINGDWSLNFGENDNTGHNATGIAEQSGGDIYPVQGAGNYLIRFNDQTKAFAVTKVVGPNQAPIARVGVDQTVGGAALVSLNGSTSSDSDGQIVGYQWLQTSGPSLSISNANQAIAQVQLPAYSGTPTIYRFRLTVTDNGGLTNSVETTIQQIAGSFSKVYPQVLVRGTNNSWASTSMNLVANNTWEVTTTFANTSTERFKFDINADWSLNFGDNNTDGVAEQNGADIKISQGAGSYLIRFNDQTKAYSVVKQ